ncbi:MAG: glycosyltransferase [Clostridia bacterium]|nr:glycosyltransferase [Clostridia bacterium]
MRLLILTCNTGEGHNSASGAIEELVLASGGTCEKVDALAFLSKAVSKAVCAVHVKLYRSSSMTKVWKKSYAKLDANSQEASDSPSFATRLLSSGAIRLRKYLKENDFDAILSTHPFSGVMLTKALEKQPLDVPCVFVCTDYTCGPMVPDQKLPFVCIPHKDLVDLFVTSGVQADTLFTTGIPVRHVFREKNSREDARRALDVPADCFNAVLMCGSMGCGPMADLAEEFASRLPEGGLLTVCCGTNKKLLSELNKKNLKNVRALGFTRDVPLWMDSADIFITKPGGLSITEAVNRGVPLLLMNVVGGCETPNFHLFLKNGYAEGVEDPAEAPALFSELVSSPERRAAMVEKQKTDFAEDAAEKIWNILQGKH